MILNELNKSRSFFNLTRQTLKTLFSTRFFIDISKKTKTQLTSPQVRINLVQNYEDRTITCMIHKLIFYYAALLGSSSIGKSSGSAGHAAFGTA